ncbi:uncharacterized protein LOC116297048 [Actinia tenebrosa]|uniref:Uncharacterized protein LOC116297048 n=1 Tax=Actinia tenebrosa TaxID=6105 RepID=A0A6P8I8R1_ACTTE|nr:uncharacterized protein LOC116297048 [Actinia tenebrosa]
MALSPILPLLVVLFGVVRCAVYDDVATVTKARCYANCITQVSKYAEPDPGCLGNACKQCLLPCDRKWTNIEDCKETCEISKICRRSCEFLGYLKGLPNILDGDLTLTKHPGVPMATEKTVQNLTLSWTPATSYVGSVVYLLKKMFQGDFSDLNLKDLKDVVFTQPRAVLDVTDVCRYAPRYRWKFDGVQFKFQVIALTEYSKLIGSAKSNSIEMTRPEPVSAVGTPSFTYDADAFGDKLKMTTTVIPLQAQVHLISQYAVDWSMAFCSKEPFVVPRSSTSEKANTTVSVQLYEKLKACNHTLKVYSLNQCIPSKPKILTYKYKGCRFVSNFKRSLCYSFDPPPTPDSARQVVSLAYSPFTYSNDFRFSTKVTWSPPTFSFGKVERYIFAYGDVNKKFMGIIWIAKRGSTKNTFLKATNLEPNITVRFEIRPRFPNAEGVVREIIFQTPGILEDKIKVQNLKADQVSFSDTSLFSFRVHWEKPVSHSQLDGYQIDFIKGSNAQKTVKTSDRFYVFRGLLHNEPLVIEVKPLYKVKWIKPKYVVLRLKAPAPSNKDIAVKRLSNFNFTFDPQTTTFTSYFEWNPPSYSYKTVDYYEVGYSIIDAHGKLIITCPTSYANKAKLCMPATTKENRYSIPRVHPHMHIVITVKPVFQHSPFLEGIKVTYTVDVPYGPVSFCDGKPEGYHADVEDCTGFYKCDANGETFRMFCPEGLYWDNDTQTCDLRSSVNCQKNNLSCCQGRPAGYYSIRHNSASYCVCDGQGRGFLRMCTSGLHWNEQRRACDFPKFRGHRHYQDINHY